LTNGHLEKFDKKIFDEFHNVNAHANLLMVSVAEEIDRETVRALITIMPCTKCGLSTRVLVASVN